MVELAPDKPKIPASVMRWVGHILQSEWMPSPVVELEEGNAIRLVWSSLTRILELHILPIGVVVFTRIDRTFDDHGMVDQTTLTGHLWRESALDQLVAWFLSGQASEA